VSLSKDVALLESNLKSNVLKMSKSGFHQQGEPILVVGSPKGYENEVSEGILGGLDRVVFLHDGAPRHVFTDAKILPGNSGGPMVSLADGSVIGMVEIIVGEEAPYGLNAAIEAEYLVQALQEMGFELSK
jgi:S1-C subfamily serine protease